MSYDYIIVGTGAGGSVLADRLSADGKHSVLVLEAGGSDRNPMNLVPKGFYFTMQNPKMTKRYNTEPFGDGTVEVWQRGWVTGGSTTINGLVWNRGSASTYDAWEAAGIHGWNFQRFLEAWKQIENHDLGGNAFRGSKGPVNIEVAQAKNEVSPAFMQASADAGIDIVEDMNSTGDDRIAIVSSNTRRGLRRSASTTFLRRARRRRNVTVLNHAEVTRVLLSGRRAIGVEAEIDGKLVQFLADREVMICGGALESPLLLERSGIGDPAVLQAAGVEQRVNSPRVGTNLSEHRGIMFQYQLDGKVGFNHQLNSIVKQLTSGAKFLLNRKGVISIGGYDVLGMFRSDPDSEDVDTQLFFTPISTAGSNPLDGTMKVDSFSGAMLIAYPIDPTSRGSIHITGPRPSDTPSIVPNYLSTEHDRDLLLKIVRKVRQIVDAPQLQALGIRQIQPEPNELTTDEQILDYSLNKGAAGYHTLGTCRIGPDPEDVVDERLRVRGVDGLRVVDASVFPAQPAGNNNAPTIAAAWIAADMILEDASSETVDLVRDVPAEGKVAPGPAVSAERER
ncbi:GMC family oxidoreductase [Rhodococcus erythropolis]|uniref:GMC family oxidoreductase n=1 Tax=Rhodococcus erythropolis TaxID=1833 RepID=UPI0022273F74|nr:GMC family oxidoreductase N-terminal domain-containing protein [Rhodococcus erythropolis]MCW2295498.1 choline dehydrogenase-like flavoprotein [Rhodococcus erythropolis]